MQSPQDAAANSEGTPALPPIPLVPETASRRHMRFATPALSQGLRIVGDDGLNVTATLVNESYSGIAAMASDIGTLRAGMRVQVDYFGGLTKGIIRRVARDAQQNWLIAVEWR